MNDRLDLSKTTLALVAHCDDLELGMGGTAAKLAAQGWVVHVFVLSSHRKRRDDADITAAEKVAEVREEETRCDDGNAPR
jgi:LmbE family N-acetylglucosaminyl deacetylase